MKEFANSKCRAACELEIILNLELGRVLYALDLRVRLWDNNFMEFKARKLGKDSVILTEFT